MSLLGPILFQALKTPRRTAAIDDNRSYSYAGLLGGAMFVAEQIDRLTAARHIGILLPTGGAFPIALLGAWLARRVAVPLNYLLAPQELHYVINDSGIDTLFTAGPLLDFLTQACGDEGLSNAIPGGVELVKLEEMDFTGLPPLRWPPRYADDDLAVLLYTSGTSGKPKGVMLSHGNLESNVHAGIQHAAITRADTFLGVLPQFHCFGLTAMTLIPLRVGATVVYTARFIPRKIVGLIRKHKPDIFMAVPSMYGALLSVKDATADDFASIRFSVSGGEPLPDATFEAYRDRFNLRLLEGYGLTETAPISNWSTPTRFKRHSVGPAVPGVTNLIVDENDKPLPPNVDGEVLIAGPNVMTGYHNLPEQTDAVFVKLDLPDRGPTRLFRTGDIGHLDDDGYLFITGRKKEMLIIGGDNVFPREIEEVLNQHESVKDSAVIGKFDGMRGEVPIAFVELTEGATFDEAALRNWCRQRLAQFKVPREVRVVDALPRSPTGKILRRQLNAD